MSGLRVRTPLLLSLLVVLLTACAQSEVPTDTPAGRLQADLDVMRQFPSGQVSTSCADALKELGSTMADVRAMQDSGKTVDPVSMDVLQSDQATAERACRADTLRLCQAVDSPASQQACSRIGK